MPEFKVGDVVRLTSSMMEMTVEAAPPGGNIRCVWFDAKSKLRRAEFLRSVLTVVKSNA